MQKERKIKFPESGKLTILQVSDPQDLHNVRHVMLKMLNKAYDDVKPDLVIFTGDNILGNHLDDAIIGPYVNTDMRITAKRMEKAIDYILDPLDKRQIPYSMIYGNHDDMNGFSKQEQAEYYLKHDMFFGLNSEEENLPCDTFNIPIYDSKGEKIAFNLWMIDSAGSDEFGDGAYSGVSTETVEWYKRKSDELKEQNGGKPVDSIMFQHIPVKEVESLFIPCGRDDKDAVRTGNGSYVKLDTKRADGYAREFSCCCEMETGEFEAIKNQGDVRALVFGHDHQNSFDAVIDGVRIVQSPGASFRCQGFRTSRAVRVFEIYENDTENINTYVLNLYDILGDNLLTDAMYLMSADETEKVRNAIWIGSAALGTAALTAGIKKLIKKRR